MDQLEINESKDDIVVSNTKCTVLPHSVQSSGVLACLYFLSCFASKSDVNCGPDANYRQVVNDNFMKKGKDLQPSMHEAAFEPNDGSFKNGSINIVLYSKGITITIN